MGVDDVVVCGAKWGGGGARVGGGVGGPQRCNATTRFCGGRVNLHEQYNAPDFDGHVRQVCHGMDVLSSWIDANKDSALGRRSLH